MESQTVELGHGAPRLPLARTLPVTMTRLRVLPYHFIPATEPMRRAEQHRDLHTHPPNNANASTSIDTPVRIRKVSSRQQACYNGSVTVRCVGMYAQPIFSEWADDGRLVGGNRLPTELPLFCYVCMHESLQIPRTRLLLFVCPFTIRAAARCVSSFNHLIG